MSDSLRPHGLQHARLPCVSSLRVCPSSCPLNQWCHPTISSSVTPFFLLPLIFPSIRVFSSESALHIRLLNYWSFSFSISPSNEYLGLISFRINWFYLLTLQGTLKSLLQHHSLRASILGCSAFFIVSYPYMWRRQWQPTPVLSHRVGHDWSDLAAAAAASIHDCWRNHAFDYTDLCQQSDILAF